jgi:hypothetical protein
MMELLEVGKAEMNFCGVTTVEGRMGHGYPTILSSHDVIRLCNETVTEDRSRTRVRGGHHLRCTRKLDACVTEVPNAWSVPRDNTITPSREFQYGSASKELLLSADRPVLVAREQARPGTSPY